MMSKDEVHRGLPRRGLKPRPVQPIVHTVVECRSVDKNPKYEGFARRSYSAWELNATRIAGRRTGWSEGSRLSRARKALYRSTWSGHRGE